MAYNKKPNYHAGGLVNAPYGGLASQGRGGDNRIRNIDGAPAHVNTPESMLIDQFGDLGKQKVKQIGSGGINPRTGLREYRTPPSGGTGEGTTLNDIGDYNNDGVINTQDLIAWQAAQHTPYQFETQWGEDWEGSGWEPYQGYEGYGDYLGGIVNPLAQEYADSSTGAGTFGDWFGEQGANIIGTEMSWEDTQAMQQELAKGVDTGLYGEEWDVLSRDYMGIRGANPFMYRTPGKGGLGTGPNLEFVNKLEDVYGPDARTAWDLARGANEPWHQYQSAAGGETIGGEPVWGEHIVDYDEHTGQPIYEYGYTTPDEQKVTGRMDLARKMTGVMSDANYFATFKDQLLRDQDIVYEGKLDVSALAEKRGMRDFISDREAARATYTAGEEAAALTRSTAEGQADAQYGIGVTAAETAYEQGTKAADTSKSETERQLKQAYHSKIRAQQYGLPGSASDILQSERRRRGKSGFSRGRGSGVSGMNRQLADLFRGARGNIDEYGRTRRSGFRGAETIWGSEYDRLGGIKEFALDTSLPGAKTSAYESAKSGYEGSMIGLEAQKAGAYTQAGSGLRDVMSAQKLGRGTAEDLMLSGVQGDIMDYYDYVQGTTSWLEAGGEDAGYAQPTY